MYCRKCGNELKENDMFCNKCGTKVESEEEIAKGIKDNKVRILYCRGTSFTPISKDILIDNKEVIVKNNEIIEYTLEEKEEHIIKWDKDNPDGIADFKFYNNNKDINILITFNNMFIGVQYKIIEGDFENQNERTKKSNISLLKLVIVVAIVLITIITMTKLLNPKSTNNNQNYTSSTSTSIVGRYNITDEVKKQIKTKWNKVAGYGTTDLNKVILDITRGNLYLVYSDTAHNGLYVYSDNTSGYNYGNEIWDKTTKKTYREYEESKYNIFLKAWPDQYKLLTKSEFVQLLNEL